RWNCGSASGSLASKQIHGAVDRRVQCEAVRRCPHPLLGVSTVAVAAVRFSRAAAGPPRKSTGPEPPCQRPGIPFRYNLGLAAQPTPHWSPSVARSACLDAPAHSGSLTRRCAKVRLTPPSETSCAPEY